MDELIRRNSVRALLEGIEAELRLMGAWASVPPPEERLRSTLPFCVDTLSFEEWLQYIFIPRMQQMLAGEQALPRKAGLEAYADVVFRERLDSTGDLRALLADMDRVLGSALSH